MQLYIVRWRAGRRPPVVRLLLFYSIRTQAPFSVCVSMYFSLQLVDPPFLSLRFYASSTRSSVCFSSPLPPSYPETPLLSLHDTCIGRRRCGGEVELAGDCTMLTLSLIRFERILFWTDSSSSPLCIAIDRSTTIRYAVHYRCERPRIDTKPGLASHNGGGGGGPSSVRPARDIRGAAAASPHIHLPIADR